MITNKRSVPVLSIACLMVLLAASSGRVCNAQEADHSHDAHHDGALHFSHPLVAESPPPDTEIRFDYSSRDLTGDEGE